MEIDHESIRWNMMAPEGGAILTATSGTFHP
jgi:hypothetical protein